ASDCGSSSPATFPTRYNSRAMPRPNARSANRSGRRPAPGTATCGCRSQNRHPHPRPNRCRSSSLWPPQNQAIFPRDRSRHARRPRRRRRPARARTPRCPGHRLPLPRRCARSGEDRAQAARRHALPDALLPHRPAPHGRGEPAGIRRGHEGDDRASRHRRGAGGGLPARPRVVPGRTRRDRVARHRLHRRRHARTRQVPARADRALPGEGAGRQPARRRIRRTRRRCRPAWHGDPRRLAHLRRAARRRAVRVAGIDCGTNSIRLLIADIAEDGSLTDVTRLMKVVRLGQGVDATGRLAPEAIERTRVALVEYADLIRETGATAVRMVATSATRDASNREDFFAMTREVLGAVIPGAEAEVITGDEEARLSFAGAVGELDSARGPFVVVDLGGGSTEVVLGDADGVHAAYSTDIGCVRLTERCLHDDPPTAEQVAAAREVAADKIREALEQVPVEQAHTWVGVAGTMTTLAALALELDEYDSEKIHLSSVPFDRLREVCDGLVAATREKRAALGPMHPGRVDVIGGGSIITTVLAEELGRRAGITELVVSEHDILDGIALSVAR